MTNFNDQRSPFDYVAARFFICVLFTGTLSTDLLGNHDRYSNDQPPNIVLLVADDLGYGELGCYGQKWIKTPNIDRIATSGVRFTQFYCGQAVCAPSRCSLMTGKHQGHAYIRDNGNPPERGKPRPKELHFPGQHPIPDNTVTMAELLKSKGYATACIGKWGLGPVGSSGDPNRQGFDLFYGFNCQVHAHNHYPRFLWRNDKQERLPGNDRTLNGETYSQDKFTEVALDFVRENKNQPFFLYMPFAIPHLSIQVPESSLKDFRGEIPEQEYNHRGYLQHPAPRAGYAAMISHMDRDIGKVTSLLAELGIDQNTIVIFTSDNGPTYDRLGGSDSVFFESAGPLKGRKGQLDDGGIRVPLVASWPKKIKPGQESDHVGAFWDLLPTFCELAGVDHPDDIDGISLAPTLLGETQPEHPFLYWEFPGYGGQQAVRMDNWKAIRKGLHKNPAAPFQLFDLANDIAESNDVASDHSHVIKEITEICRREHSPSELFKFPALDSPIVEQDEDRFPNPNPRSPVAPRVGTSDRPNVVLIVSDDAGYADFSIQGSEQIETPRIDSIAEEGVRFLQGYVSASVCSPSRAGLMTGRYQQRFGHEMNIPPRMSDENGLPVDELTLAQAFRDNDYCTIALGKWHLGYADHFHPLSRGFQHYFGFLQGARKYWPMQNPTKLNQLLRDRQVVPESFEYMTDELGREAAKYIGQFSDVPFFLYLSYNAVHTPMHALEKDLNKIPESVPDKRRKLIAMTHALDRSVGYVLESLSENGIADNTMVVFINDNGGATNNASRNGKLRGKKGSPFEGGIRVPYFVRWPNRWPSTTTFEHPVSTLDIFPTVLTAAGVDVSTLPKPLDGVDLDPFVRGQRSDRPHPTLYWRRGQNWAIRQGDLKLLSARGGESMLFDLAKDASEKDDLASEQSDSVDKLRQEFDAWNAQLIPAKWHTTSRKQQKKKQ